MAKNTAVRDRSQETESVKRDSKSFKGVRREILFPTEPSTIGREKIDRAIDRVVSRRKAATAL